MLNSNRIDTDISGFQHYFNVYSSTDYVTECTCGPGTRPLP